MEPEKVQRQGKRKPVPEATEPIAPTSAQLDDSEYFAQINAQTGGAFAKQDNAEALTAFRSKLPRDLATWQVTQAHDPSNPFQRTFDENRELRLSGDEHTGVANAIAFVSGYRFVLKLEDIKNRIDLRWDNAIKAVILDESGAEVETPIDSHERSRRIEREGTVYVIGRRV